MDSIDIANRHVERERQYAIDRARAKVCRRPEPDGFCHQCGKGLHGASQIFCGPACAEGWERKQ